MNETETAHEVELMNSLTALVGSLTNQSVLGNGAPLSQSDTLFYNLRWYLVSNNRQLLSQLYVEHGIVQTLVDQPVDDAFRAGFDIRTDLLTTDEIEHLKIYCEKHRVIDTITQALKWMRLYGGGGILLINDESPDKPFFIKSLKEESPIEFRAVDMWELYYNQINVNGQPDPATTETLDDEGQFYDYYGKRVHRSRVYRLDGKQAPSFVRPRLRGWGMSELERLVRSINQYMKNQDVVFELLDEAKVDIYKIDGFNTALLRKEGTSSISQRIQAANFIKNYNNALTMDTKDEYEQKQITFSGLSDILMQIRQGLAADLKMPMTKLFGMSSAGFNSGEDDIENYNSMIEGEVRSKVKYIIVDILGIICQKEFGIIPEDLTVSFPPLRILGAEEEETVKEKQFNRVMSGWQSGLIDTPEAKKAINKDSLMPIDIDENSEAVEPPVKGNFTTDPTDNP